MLKKYLIFPNCGFDTTARCCRKLINSIAQQIKHLQDQAKNWMEESEEIQSFETFVWTVSLSFGSCTNLDLCYYTLESRTLKWTKGIQREEWRVGNKLLVNFVSTLMTDGWTFLNIGYILFYDCATPCVPLALKHYESVPSFRQINNL